MDDRLRQVADIAVAAGREILDVYAGDFEVETKGDGSPLTQADRRAHDLIYRQLRRLDPGIPVLSEESGAEAFARRLEWSQLWLVDPLDGTKGFVNRNDQFTVNIALVEAGRPVLGVVYAPVKGNLYAAAGGGAFKVGPNGARARIRVKKCSRHKVVMVASRSHAGPLVEAYRARLAGQFDQVAITGMASSLKMCLVAEGLADIYPRLSPTSEWDTAAAQCVLESAGGSLTTLCGEPLKYNKESILNPWFLAGGDPDFDWAALARGLQ